MYITEYSVLDLVKTGPDAALLEIAFMQALGLGVFSGFYIHACYLLTFCKIGFSSHLHSTLKLGKVTEKRCEPKYLVVVDKTSPILA